MNKKQLTDQERAALKRATLQISRDGVVLSAVRDFQAACRETLIGLGAFWPLLAFYLQLLDMEIQSDDEECFYLRGKQDRLRGVPWQEGLAAYINERQGSPENEAVWRSINALSRVIAKLLTFGAVDELTGLYREVYGVYRQNISVFYRLGYEYEG